jgi:hypothetical protein
MRHDLLTRCAAALAALATLAWPRAAAATPDFPAAVEQDLALPSITVDPPRGCTLCHPTDSGGTELKAFGHLLQQYGAQPYDTASLKQALAQVAIDEPQLVADIKAGRDPSSDTTTVHTPEYGCSSATPGAAPRQATPWPPALALLALLARFRRWRGARSRHRPRRAPA